MVTAQGESGKQGTRSGPTVSPDQPPPESAKLAESLVIVEFIADLYLGSSLLPKDPLQRARARFFIYIASNKLIPGWYAAIARGESLYTLYSGVEAVENFLPVEGKGKFATVDEFNIADVAIASFLGGIDLNFMEDLGKYAEGEGKRAHKSLSSDPKYASFKATFDEDKAPGSTPCEETYLDNYVKETLERTKLTLTSMCRNHESDSPSARNHERDPSPPTFHENLIAKDLSDGYWLEAFPFSTKSKFPDLVSFGLGFADQPSVVQLYTNPKNKNGGYGWSLTEIQKLDFAVGMTFADLTGNGYNDIIIADRYGRSMGDLWDDEKQEGGRVLWLRNPGTRESKGHWEVKLIGSSTGMHRLKAGHFTTKRSIQIMALPILPASGDNENPVPVIIYTPKYGPDMSLGPESWTSEIAFPSDFCIIHDVTLIPSSSSEGFDMALISSREGVVLLWYEHGRWKHNIVGKGTPREDSNPYWGSGSADVASTLEDSVTYIAACEAFHGNTVAVYVKKDKDAAKGPESLKNSSLWIRITIDNFGPLYGDHMGSTHHVAAADFDGTGVESFVVACMGYSVGMPHSQGVYLYTPVDITAGSFVRTRITDKSAARVAVGRFSTSCFDVGSISYYVPGYHIAPELPSIRLNVNVPASRTSIFVTKLDQTVLIRVPRPSNVPANCVPSLPTIEVAGKRLSVVVLPPNSKVTYKPEDGLKVIYGEVHMVDKSNAKIVRRLAPPVKQYETFRIVSVDGGITAGPSGAVFYLIEEIPNEYQGPFSFMAQLPSRNVFPLSAPADVRSLEFPFKKVQTLSWASSGLWEDTQFYNLSGFHVYFNDDNMESLTYLRLWTLGLGETARFHNHYDQSFCEIHACISNGGSSGGMRLFKDGVYSPNQIDPKLEEKKDWVEEHSDFLVVPTMTEQGPLWRVQPGYEAHPVIRPNDTVDYPWHGWLASDFGKHQLPIAPPLSDANQKYDVWMVFEFPSSAFQY